MSSSVETLLARVLSARGCDSLDAPTLAFLAAAVQEEVDFLAECPRSMTGAQVLHLLTEKLEDVLVTYEIAQTEEEARSFCAQVVHAMQEADLVQLAEDADGDDSSAAAASSSSPAALLAASPPLLSAAVSVSDILRADAASLDPTFTSLASIQRIRHGWSAAEEAVLFQSLAESNERRAAEGDEGDEEEEEVVDEGGCQMCQRQMPLTRHHLIPRKVHGHSKYASMSKDVLNTCVLICRPCHSAVHKFEDERSLAASFNTLDKLMADERIQRFVAYISKRKVNRAPDQVGIKGMRYGR